MKMTKKINAGEQITTLNSELHSPCENQRPMFFGDEWSLPQVMVPKGGDEAETPAHKLLVIFFT